MKISYLIEFIYEIEFVSRIASLLDLKSSKVPLVHCSFGVYGDPGDQIFWHINRRDRLNRLRWNIEIKLSFFFSVPWKQ